MNGWHPSLIADNDSHIPFDFIEFYDDGGIMKIRLRGKNEAKQNANTII